MRVRRRFAWRVLPFAGAVLAACAEPPPPLPEPVFLDLGEDTVVLAPGSRVHDVMITAAAGASEFVPARPRVKAGDVIRFTARDAGPHALRFEVPGADSAAAFLERTGQLRALPLIGSGAAWVVSFEQAPNGRYVVRCLTHDQTMEFEVTAAAGPGR